jgi:hypothetical protein
MEIGLWRMTCSVSFTAKYVVSRLLLLLLLMMMCEINYAINNSIYCVYVCVCVCVVSFLLLVTNSYEASKVMTHVRLSKMDI